MSGKELDVQRHDDIVLELSDLKKAMLYVPALNEWASKDFQVTTYDDSIFALCCMDPGEFSSKISRGISLTEEEVDKFYEFYESYRMILNNARNDCDTVIKKCKQEIACITKFDKKEIIDEWDYLLSEYNKAGPLIKSHLDCVYIDSHVPVDDRDGNIIGYWDVVILIINSPICGSSLKFGKIMEGDNELYDIIRIDILVKPVIYDFNSTLRQIDRYRSQLGEYCDPRGEDRSVKNIIYLVTDDLKYKEAFESRGIRYIQYKE